MPKPEDARQPLPSRNPLPLSAAQEAKVKELYHKRVRSYCAEEIKGVNAQTLTLYCSSINTYADFAECATGRSFSVAWACRQQKIKMNHCMMAHAGQDEEDRAREDFFAGALQRRAEREQKEQKKNEQEKFHREWWESDEREGKSSSVKS